MAQTAPVALILRRGPSAWYHLIRWNTRADTFEHGAWFKGRIYEERCDLSPDGSLFLYFALQGSRFRSTYAGAWTAVSRTPWLHALALWPQGHTWGGGGRFLGDREVALHMANGSPTHPDHPAHGLDVTYGRRGTFRETDFGPDDWVGEDQAGEKIRARGGKLFRTRDGEEVELADWNDLTPDPQPPPGRAKELLRPVRKKPRSRGGGSAS